MGIGDRERRAKARSIGPFNLEGAGTHRIGRRHWPRHCGDLAKLQPMRSLGLLGVA